MSVFSICRRSSAVFNCRDSIEYYKCFSCNYKAKEKVSYFHHKCEVSDTRYKASFKRCRRCKVGSFSAVWRCFHYIKCTFIEDSSAENKCLLAKLKEEQFLTCFECDQCNYTTKYKSDLKRHMNARHSPNTLGERFKCNQCSFKTNYTHSFKRHKQAKHCLIGFQKWSQCDHCKYRTGSDTATKDLKRPLSESQIVEKSYFQQKLYCDQCEFKTVYYKKLACNQCAYTTTLKSSLNEHEKIKHLFGEFPKKFSCNQCDFVSNYQRNLKSHIKGTHLSNDLIERFQCDQCKFITKYRHSLKSHKMTKHLSSELQPTFFCDQCDFATIDRAFLRKHRNGKHAALSEKVMAASATL